MFSFLKKSNYYFKSKKSDDTQQGSVPFLSFSGLTRESTQRNSWTLRGTKISQSGSVMLEVIAVLALMGVMGAMLYRQIYQRNQELHNIQMASEIRTVKEAFSAYIQAERSNLIEDCPTPDLAAQPCTASGNAADYSNTLAGNSSRGIRSYLPDGWFTGSISLANAYHFSLWIQKQNDVTQKTVLYGVIVPTELTIPQTGWNFKRAARVALLVGADGGVYDQGGMTGNNINGALGTWELIVADQHEICSGRDCPRNTFVAVTGMDIFTPEYEAPQVSVNIPEEWRLALQQSHVWQQFSAGSPDGSSCYSIGHNVLNNHTGEVGQDTVDISCNPLFYVDSASATVVVNNDLDVKGSITTPGLNIAPDGRLVADRGNDNAGQFEHGTTAIGELAQNENYVLDPAYTSTMNDIRLASRGGVLLSDILPDYILKRQTAIAGNGNLDAPACPSGYTAALVVLPINHPEETVNLTNNGTDIAADSFPVNTNLASLEGSVEVTHPAGGDGTTNHNVTFSNTIAGKGMNEFPGTADLRNLQGTVPQTCVQITPNGAAADNDGLSEVRGNTINNAWSYTVGTINAANNCVANANARAIAQTYCVYAGAVFTTNASCGAAGGDWIGGRCIVNRTANTTHDRYRDQAPCLGAGLTWANNRCQNIYNLDNINNHIADENTKRATCRAAGFRWIPGANGNNGNCTDH